MLGKLNFIERKDVVKFIAEKNIKMLNLCHIPEDGRLKTLTFTVPEEKQIHQILEFGERVDGSSLFSYLDPDKSDIYIMPKLETAFINPFCSTPTLNILCSYLDENGNALSTAPETILSKIEEKLRSSKGLTLKALAELEFYVISKQETETLFPNLPDKHYHESAPFSEFEHVRNEIQLTLTDIGITTKYGHAEVGKTYGKNCTVMEQHEIETMPQDLIKTAQEIAIIKWVIRNTCAKHGVSVSFSPKVALEHAGNGLHLHLCALKNDKNVIEKPNASLTPEAKKMIGGLLKFAQSLTAFGNSIPISYLRFESHLESPMHICWGARNRLALIRIPLWWDFKKTEEIDNCRRTFEFRAPDPSADSSLLLAGIAVAIRYGLKNPQEALRIAEELHLEKKAKEKRRLKLLPHSCHESAAHLRRDRKHYEADEMFPKVVIDNTIKKLESFKDRNLWQRLSKNPQASEELIQKYLHYT